MSAMYTSSYSTCDTNDFIAQARVQEFVRGGGPKSESLFFLLFNFSGGGGAAQKIDEIMIFSTKKVAKYFFFCFSISRGGGGAGPLGPPGHAPVASLLHVKIDILDYTNINYSCHCTFMTHNT